MTDVPVETEVNPPDRLSRDDIRIEQALEDLVDVWFGSIV
jgi:hypothetical protein